MFTTIEEMKEFIAWARAQGIAQFDVVGVKVLFAPEAVRNPDLQPAEGGFEIPSPPTPEEMGKPLPTPPKKYGSYQDLPEDELFLSAEGGK